MDYPTLFQSRYTCRAYKDKPVSKECLIQVLTEATRAPSWSNSQPWEIFVAAGEKCDELRAAYLESFEKGVPINPDIPRPERWPAQIEARMSQFGAEKMASLGIERDNKEARYAHVKNNYHFFGAPVVAYLCMDKTLSEWSVLDLGQFAQSLMLAAKAYGLDTAPSFTLASYPDLVREILDVPSHLKIVVGIAIGYGDPDHLQNQHKTSRVPLEEVVHFKGM